MNEERYVAAIEISSSKITVMAGKIHESGQLDVIACEQEKSVEGVRYGVIQNLEDTSMRISRLIARLERKPAIAPRRIESLFVGLSGRSVRSIVTEVSMALPEETEITDDIIDNLRKQAFNTPIEHSLEVIDAIPRVYKVGKIETHSPKGAVGSSISAKFDLIVCRPELKRNLVRTLPEKLGIKIEGVIVTALCTGQIILTSEQKRLGCMFVDMGAETTTITIYKNGHLLYFATIPLGGRNITRDITTLNLLEERAEEIKVTSGNAIARENPSTLNMNGVRMSDISNLIVARSEEIVANVIEQIAYAGLKEKDLPAGIVVIGGASKLNGITELLANHSGLRVERGALPPYIHMEDTKGTMPELMEVASVLYTGATNCTSECLREPERNTVPVTGTAEVPEEQPENRHSRRQSQRGKSFFGKMKNKITNIFANPEDDSDELIE